MYIIVNVIWKMPDTGKALFLEVGIFMRILLTIAGIVILIWLAPLMLTVTLGLLAMVLKWCGLAPSWLSDQKHSIKNRCSWFEVDQQKHGIMVWRDLRTFAFLEADGEYLLPQSAESWREVVGRMEESVTMPMWTTGQQISVAERVKVVEKALDFLNQTALVPEIVLLPDRQGENGGQPMFGNQTDFAFWQNYFQQQSRNVKNVRVMPALEFTCQKWGRLLSHQVFGQELLEKVADLLVQGCTVMEYHRDYCGHGLLYAENKFVLAEIYDGGPQEPFLAQWPDRQAFVAFFAAQSDYSCSGADQGSAVFKTSNPWEIGNQRITQARLEKIFS